MPTSRSEATRPRSRTVPSVGSTIRLRIFSSVDLPAPLRPTMPTTSPRSTSKQTSFSAQNGWSSGSLLAPGPFEDIHAGAEACRRRLSRSDVVRAEPRAVLLPWQPSL